MPPLPSQRPEQDAEASEQDALRVEPVGNEVIGVVIQGELA
jgi:hypothetical protein